MKIKKAPMENIPWNIFLLINKYLDEKSKWNLGLTSQTNYYRFSRQYLEKFANREKIWDSNLNSNFTKTILWKLYCKNKSDDSIKTFVYKYRIDINNSNAFYANKIFKFVSKTYPNAKFIVNIIGKMPLIFWSRLTKFNDSHLISVNVFIDNYSRFKKCPDFLKYIKSDVINKINFIDSSHIKHYQTKNFEIN